ncbi:MAG TPA: N-acetyltransferase [Pirellulales bacterium]|nr:N-acetyltransferase [Pirellulales bacterium]
MRDGALLAPLAVLPKFQGRRIGTLLVREGMALLRERGDPLVCVFGYPGYYNRFGFEGAARFGIECEFGGGDGVFQIAWLRGPPEVFDGALLRYHPEFSRFGHEESNGGVSQETANPDER